MRVQRERMGCVFTSLLPYLRASLTAAAPLSITEPVSRLTTPAHARLWEQYSSFAPVMVNFMCQLDGVDGGQASLSFTIFLSLLKLMSVMPSNHLILCLPPSSLALSLSQHQGLSQ